MDLYTEHRAKAEIVVDSIVNTCKCHIHSHKKVVIGLPDRDRRDNNNKGRNCRGCTELWHQVDHLDLVALHLTVGVEMAGTLFLSVRS